MNKRITLFSSIIIVLSVLSSLVGLLFPYQSNLDSITSVNNQVVDLYGKGLYFRDSVSVASQGIASDFITLVIAVPLLIYSLVLFKKGSFKGQVLLTGMLGYFAYTYISYTFLWNFNFMFLVYVALMSLSLLTLVLTFQLYDYENIKEYFNDRLPKRFLGRYQVLVALFVGMMWLNVIVQSILNQTSPEILEHYTTLVIQALDLGFVVPAAIVSGVSIIKEKKLGYLLSSVIIVKAAMMLLAIFAMIVNQYINGVNVGVAEASIFGLFTLVSFYALYKLISNIKEKEVN